MIYSIIVSTLYFAAVGVFALRLINESGVSLQNGFCKKVCTYSISDERETNIGIKKCIKIFGIAFLFRIAVLLFSWLVYGLLQHTKITPLFEFLNNWNLWDGPHYIDMTENGYAWTMMDGKSKWLMFLSLHYWIVRIFNVVCLNYVLSELIVSYLYYGIGCVILYKLLLMDYSRKTAMLSIILLSLSPINFVFGAVAPESRFFLTTVAIFYAIRKHNWLAVGILGIVAALMRSFSILMIVPAVVEWLGTSKIFEMIKEKRFKEIGREIISFLPSLIMLGGVVMYFLINYITAGNPFTNSQNEEFQFFGSTLHMMFSKTFPITENRSLFMIWLVSAILAVVMIVLTSRKIRLMYLVFMLTYFAYNLGGSLNLSRFLLCMFPIYFEVANFCRKRRGLDFIALAISAVLFGIYVVGYIIAHQVV